MGQPTGPRSAETRSKVSGACKHNKSCRLKSPALCQASCEAADIHDFVQFSQPYRCVLLPFSLIDGKTKAETSYVICLWLVGGRTSSEPDP